METVLVGKISLSYFCPSCKDIVDAQVSTSNNTYIKDNKFFIAIECPECGNDVEIMID